LQYKTYETSRLKLCLTNLEDAKFILELMNTDQWINFIGDRNVSTIQDAEMYITSKMLDQAMRLGYGNYTVIRKSDGAKVGTCGLYDRVGMDGLDIGFALLPQYNGQGYAYEASRKLLEVAFTELGQTSLSGITTELNIKSKALLTKLGMKRYDTIALEGDDKAFIHYVVQKEEIAF